MVWYIFGAWHISLWIFWNLTARDCQGGGGWWWWRWWWWWLWWRVVVVVGVVMVEGGGGEGGGGGGGGGGWRMTWPVSSRIVTKGTTPHSCLWGPAVGVFCEFNVQIVPPHFLRSQLSLPYHIYSDRIRKFYYVTFLSKTLCFIDITKFKSAPKFKVPLNL